MVSANLDFKIVFEPYDKSQFNNKRRFAIGAGKLANYVGEENAQTLIDKAYKSGKDKIRFRLRTKGIIDFYSK